MNYKEFKKYVDEMNESIANKLKDTYEELAFYTELVKKFNSVCKKTNKLEQALDEIEKYIKSKFVAQVAFTSYEWNDLLSDVLQIINKTKGEN